MRWIGAGVVVAAILVAIWWFARSDPKPPRPHAVRSATIELDLAAFKRLRSDRVVRAKQLAKQHPRKRSDSVVADMQITRELAGKECLIGTAALCDSLTEVFADCDAGEGAACLAIGQFIADNPPRAMIATMAFAKACGLGEQDACAYMEKLNKSSLQRCADDPFICQFRAMAATDIPLLQEACTLGAADACSMASWFGGDKLDDPVTSQRYLEKACQLGLPMACQGLADRLSASCEPHEIGDDLVTPCYPIDEALAAKARAIGCEAGWGEGCSYN